MDVPAKVFKWISIILLVGMVALVLFSAIKRHSYEAELVRLQNAVASRDQTIETQKGVYQKLAIQSTNLQGMLDQKDEQVKLLEKELKKNHEDLLAANSLVLKWKQAYEAQVAANQTEVPGTDGKTRTKVEFAKDFGYIGVNGWTLTNPAEAFIKVQQNRPLKLTVAVSQDKDGTWKTRTTSSEENVSVDIGLASVNPYLLEPKWYEHIGFSIDVGYGSGFLGGIGASYQIGQWEFGPKVWFTVAPGLSGVQFNQFYGAGLTWHPFQKTTR